MSIVSKNARLLLAGLAVLLALAFLFPFSLQGGEGEAPASASGFDLLSGTERARLNGETFVSSAKGVNFSAQDGGERGFVHYCALILLCAALGLGAALTDLNGAKKYGVNMAAGLLGVLLTAWLMRLVASPFTLSAGEDVAGAVQGRAGWGLKAALVLSALLFALASLGLYAHRKNAPVPAPASRSRLTFIARTAVLGAIAAILYYFDVPVIPPIYKLDLSMTPALIAGFSMGPLASLGVILVKDLIGLLHSSSMGVGELADFLMSGSMAAVAALIYVKKHTFKGALAGLAAGTLVMAAVGALANYFIMIPFYVQVMNLSEAAIIGMVAKTVPMVDSMWKLILLAVAPFNLLKGAVVSVVTLLLYKRISPLLKRG